jgi:hypothetical protein
MERSKIGLARLLATVGASAAVTASWHLVTPWFLAILDRESPVTLVVGIAHSLLVAATITAVAAVGLRLHEAGSPARLVGSAVVGLSCGLTSTLAVYRGCLTSAPWTHLVGPVAANVMVRSLVFAALIMAGTSAAHRARGRRSRGIQPPRKADDHDLGL